MTLTVFRVCAGGPSGPLRQEANVSKIAPADKLSFKGQDSLAWLRKACIITVLAPFKWQPVCQIVLCIVRGLGKMLAWADQGCGKTSLERMPRKDYGQHLVATLCQGGTAGRDVTGHNRAVHQITKHIQDHLRGGLT